MKIIPLFKLVQSLIRTRPAVHNLKSLGNNSVQESHCAHIKPSQTWKQYAKIHPDQYLDRIYQRTLTAVASGIDSLNRFLHHLSLKTTFQGMVFLKMLHSVDQLLLKTRYISKRGKVRFFFLSYFPQSK